MTQAEAQTMLDSIFGQVTGIKNPYNLEEFMQKFAFDIRLPVIVYDSVTGEQTWAQSLNPTKFITKKNAFEMIKDWQLPKQDLKSVDDILAAWSQFNYTATERYVESIHVAESDNINHSEYVYRSQDIHRSKKVLFSDTIFDSEYVAATQRCNNTTYSMRVQDCTDVANSFTVSGSAKITNSVFISDCFDMYECMFCTQMSGKKYCIANMQFEEAEYMELKQKVMEWIASQ